MTYFHRTSESAETQLQPNLKLMLPSMLAKAGVNVAQSVGAPPIVGAAIGGAIGGMIVAVQDLKEQSPTKTAAVKRY